VRLITSGLMYWIPSLVSLALLTSVRAQRVGTQLAENHPKLTTQRCTKSGCTTQSTSVVLDADWRWLHAATGYSNCFTGNKWDASLCPDPKTCANNCAIEGADYKLTNGISTNGDALTLKFVASPDAAIGSRVYLLAEDTKYYMFKLKNQEFVFDVDASNLPCELKGALYLTEMEEDGGISKYPSNKAGAKYGTGYCDSKCPHNVKFIAGEVSLIKSSRASISCLTCTIQANILGWNTTYDEPGSGRYGACCTELDIWEANSNAAAYTAHPCKGTGLIRCDGIDCGDHDVGVCDKDGCDFNSWRMGNQTFLKAGGAFIDTKKKFTVVTQFITSDGTSSGDLSEIKRFYMQNGKVYGNSKSTIPGV
jgi:cellulose 1,4-beta-cellobiosidase